jgi:PAS domain S-box-containing protein
VSDPGGGSSTADEPTGRAERALLAAGLGVWDWNVVTGELVWSRRIAELHGFDPPEAFDGTLDMFLSRIHGDDLPAVQAAIQQALTRGGSFATEFRVLRPDGSTAWIQGWGEAVVDADGTPLRMTGVGMDATVLRSPRLRVARTLEHLRDGLVMTDLAWVVVYANAAALAFLRLSHDALVGHNFWEVFPTAVGSELWERCHAAMETQEFSTFEGYYGPIDGWFEVRTLPAPDGLTVHFQNINDRRAAEAERAALVSSLERALIRERQSNTIAVALTHTRTVAEVASSFLDYSQTTLDALVGSVALLDEPGGRLRFVALESLPETVAQWMIVPIGERTAVTDCVRSMRPAYHESRSQLFADYPHLRSNVEMAGNAFAHLPLVIEGRVFGALSMSWSKERAFTADDRSFMTTMAALCAQAVDRCVLSERQTRVVETLQRAILPDSLPEIPGAELCARYLPATKGVLLGGDWYDAFTLPDGRLALTIGDVGGHGVPAASVMGQLRNAMRAYTFDGDPPASVLTKLDALVSSSDHGLLVTAVIAIYDPSSGQVVWAGAGHPPPLVQDGLHAGFAAEPAMPLLGTGTTPRYTTRRLVLAEGSLLLLYTDGLVEHRTTTLDRGLETLRREVDGARGEPLDQLCDRIIVATRGALAQEDDLCLLALRRSRADTAR